MSLHHRQDQESILCASRQPKLCWPVWPCLWLTSWLSSPHFSFLLELICPSVLVYMFWNVSFCEKCNRECCHTQSTQFFPTYTARTRRMEKPVRLLGSLHLKGWQIEILIECPTLMLGKVKKMWQACGFHIPLLRSGLRKMNLHIRYRKLNHYEKTTEKNITLLLKFIYRKTVTMKGK